MTSTTWPSGLERPVIPISHRERPLPSTVRPCDPHAAGAHEAVRPSHIAAWCLSGMLAWSSLAAAGWLVTSLLGRL